MSPAGAPKGNKNAARDGHEKHFRVRVKSADDLADITQMDTYERGIALIGYLLWQESPESDGNNFVDWMKEKCRYHGIEWE
jgi:hypothetical protein